MSDPKLFIRPVNRIVDARNSRSVAYAASIAPHLFGDLFLSVPVDPTDSVEGLRETLKTMLEVRKAAGGLGYLGTLSLSSNDWKVAIECFLANRPALALVDPEALPYDEERELCPTNWLIQIIPILEEDTALDLYMEVLNRAACGEKWSPDISPASYLEATCYLSEGGEYFSRKEAAEEGFDCTAGRVMTLKQVFESHKN